MSAEKTLREGMPAPDFTLPDASQNDVSLSRFRGQWVVLYFYPKDNTSGCTKEAIAFSEQLPEFSDLNAVVLGVSPDSPRSHEKFIAKQNLKITLLSDESREVLTAYGVWKKKSMYGREYMGVLRSTFLIDPEGIIRAEWRNVRVKGHVETVRERLSEAQNK